MSWDWKVTRTVANTVVKKTLDTFSRISYKSID
jgi:hypothetical protein